MTGQRQSTVLEDILCLTAHPVRPLELDLNSKEAALYNSIHCKFLFCDQQVATQQSQQGGRGSLSGRAGPA